MTAVPPPLPPKQRKQSAAQAAAEEAALRARIAAVQRLRAGLAEPSSTLCQTVAAYGDLLDELLVDVAVDVTRSVRSGQDDLSDVAQPAEPAGVFEIRSGPANPQRGCPDAFGQQVPTTANTPISCSNCGKRMSASRFAPHLEKCLGVGDRGAARPSRNVRPPIRE